MNHSSDGSYLNKEKKQQSQFMNSSYKWLIQEDTTIAENLRVYDQIIYDIDKYPEHMLRNARPYKYYASDTINQIIRTVPELKPALISDHIPIEMNIHCNKVE